MGKCKFLKQWLGMKDSNGHIVSDWGIQRENNLNCVVCNMMPVNIDKGFYAIKRYSDSEKHKSNFAAKKNSNQLSLSCHTSSLSMLSIKDQAYKAEITWCLKMISSNFPLSTCKDVDKVFNCMFPSSTMEHFSLNPTKATYLITDALAPYFRNEFLDEIKNSFYTLQFDETTNNANFKELYTRVRFWSEKSKKVFSHHLETFFLGHAKAENVMKHLKSAIDNAGLNISNLLMLSSDGPNVNKAIFNLMNEEIKSTRGVGLLQMGFCNIHMLHNAFIKGLNVFGCNTSDLAIVLFHYFDGWPARKEDFRTVLVEKKLQDLCFIKHSTSRWLTLEPAVMRILELWDGIVHYFLKFIPLRERKLDSASYKKIVSLLKLPLIKAELNFVCASSAILTKYTRFFQNEGPLVQELYDCIKELLLKIGGRVCKPETLTYLKKSTCVLGDIFDQDSLLPSKDIVLEKNILDCLIQCSDVEKRNFMLNVQKHFVTIGCYILKKGPLMNELLSILSCIKPGNIKKANSLKKIQEIASLLPFPSKMGDVIDEWKLLQLEVIEEKPIEKFWSDIFEIQGLNGSVKYMNLEIIITAVLTLAHGSADVERAFSKSGRILSEERASMSSRTLNAHLTVADALKAYNNKPEMVPISEKLLCLARVAYKSYNLYLELEKEKKEKDRIEKEKKLEELKEAEEKESMLKKSKMDISILEDKLKTAKKEVKDSTTTIDTLLEEANKKLKKALMSNNIAEAKVAQAMIDGVLVTKVDCKTKEKTIKTLDRQLHKRKDSVITSFFSKKPRQ